MISEKKKFWLNALVVGLFVLVVYFSFKLNNGNGDAPNGGDSAEMCPPTPLPKEALLDRKLEGHQRNILSKLEEDLRLMLLEQRRVLTAQSFRIEDMRAHLEAMEKEGATRIVSDRGEIIKDQSAAVALGKALFWDMQIGSDNQTACATCHFRAGADGRNNIAWLQNQRRNLGLDPADLSAEQKAMSLGVDRRFLTGIKSEEGEEFSEKYPETPEEAVEKIFQYYKNRFPQSSDDLDRLKDLVFASYVQQRDSGNSEASISFFTLELKQYFHAEEEKKRVSMRQMTGRNAPTIINAVTADRLFHDGRASSIFNGYDNLGNSAGPDGIGKWVMTEGGHYQRVLVRIAHAALASQSTLPVLSPQEMSWFGREFHHIADKILGQKPLRFQKTSPTDSVLGAYLDRNDPDKGIPISYMEFFKLAFHDKWTSESLIPIPKYENNSLDGKVMSLSGVKANFSLLWGLALEAYQSTLISDESPYDRMVRGGDALSDSAYRGRVVFNSIGCSECHQSPEFAGATKSQIYGPLLEFEPVNDMANPVNPGNEFMASIQQGGLQPPELVEGMIFPRSEGSVALPYDAGFYNIGVVPDGDDPGIGATSFSVDQLPNRAIVGSGRLDRLLAHMIGQADDSDEEEIIESFTVPENRYISYALRGNEEAAVIGAFRSSTLRNITLTSPYFHNGSVDSLEGAIRFYAALANSNNRHFHPELRELRNELVGEIVDADIEVSEFQENVDLILRFLESLEDPRVLDEQPPFDHPSILIPLTQEVGKDGKTAISEMLELSATGSEP